MKIMMHQRRKAHFLSITASVLIAAAAVMLIAGGAEVTTAAAESNSNSSTKSDIPRKANQYIIAQDGTGDFITIQEGVDNALDGDTLIIYPGTYTEEVQVMNKEINIVGVSRDLCILQYDTTFYRKVPLTMAVGKVSNLTIYGMNSGVEQAGPTEEEIARINAELVGDSWDRQKNYKGYAVHIDQNCLYGKGIYFENCRVISENNHCVGIGARGSCTIRFENCELISAGGGSCIFMHDPTSAEVSGDASLIMKDCCLTSYLCPYVMTFQSLFPAYNTMLLTFQNTHVRAIAYAESSSYTLANVNTGFDVETLSMLEQTGALYTTGLSSTAPILVHEMQLEDSLAYMEELEKAIDTGDYTRVMAIGLPEGITYIDRMPPKSKIDTENKSEIIETTVPFAKHQVIAIYNADNQPSDGWCGLSNSYLTEDSFGNTLVEMNTIVNVERDNPYIADSALSASYENGH